MITQKIDWSAQVETVIQTLAAIPGIGIWTTQYIALRALGEPDAFPASDLILRRVCGSADAALTTRALEKRSNAWRPWRGYAVMHLWDASRLVQHLSVRTRERITPLVKARRPLRDEIRLSAFDLDDAALRTIDLDQSATVHKQGKAAGESYCRGGTAAKGKSDPVAAEKEVNEQRNAGACDDIGDKRNHARAGTEKRDHRPSRL